MSSQEYTEAHHNETATMESDTDSRTVYEPTPMEKPQNDEKEWGMKSEVIEFKVDIQIWVNVLS